MRFKFEPYFEVGNWNGRRRRKLGCAVVALPHACLLLGYFSPSLQARCSCCAFFRRSAVALLLLCVDGGWPCHWLDGVVIKTGRTRQPVESSCDKLNPQQPLHVSQGFLGKNRSLDLLALSRADNC